jgi:hypothetical protein
MTLWLLWIPCRGVLRKLLPTIEVLRQVPSFSIFDLVAIVDPVSWGAQKIAPVLEVLLQVPGFSHLLPCGCCGSRVAGRSEDCSRPGGSPPGTRFFLSMTLWLSGGSPPGTRLFPSIALWPLWIPCRGALRRLLPSWRFSARYQAFPIFSLVAVVDPVSRGAHKIAPVLEVLLQVPGFSHLWPCGCCGFRVAGRSEDCSRPGGFPPGTFKDPRNRFQGINSASLCTYLLGILEG